MGKVRLVANPITAARTRHHMAPSKISIPFVRLGRVLVPAYLRFTLLFQKIEILDAGQIIEAIRDFQEKRTRLIVAFRHPYGDEPQLLFHVFENMIPQLAKRMRNPLPRQPYLRLVHDYAVPLWGDAFIRYLLPRVGAMPVYHSKCEPASLTNIRSVLRDGANPLGLAPEGQISYHSETLPRIELGTIRMGFWCASDIDKSSRAEHVVVLPLSVHYRYDLRDIKKVQSAIERMESLCGIAPAPKKTPAYTKISNLPYKVGQEARNNTELLAGFLPRMEEIEARILDIAERFYSDTYGYQPPDHRLPEEDEAAARQRRWDALQPFALGVAEHTLGIDANADTIVQRMYRIRLEGWERIYPQESINRLSPLEAGLYDRRAGEGWFAMRHMEFVDLMHYHDVRYLKGGEIVPSYDRIVETVMTLEDLVHRLMGGNITNRPNQIRKRAFLVPAPCLDLAQRLTDYRKNPKQAARDATDELAKRFEDCIERYRNER